MYRRFRYGKGGAKCKDCQEWFATICTVCGCPTCPFCDTGSGTTLVIRPSGITYLPHCAACATEHGLDGLLALAQAAIEKSLTIRNGRA
jgi:hypothetical protein